MKTWREMIIEAKQGITLLQPQDVKEKLENRENFTLIDCRESDEFQTGHLSGAVFIPRGVLEMTAEQRVRDKDKAIVVYCAGGGRSAMAAQSLKQMGYSDVASMEGGFGGWQQFGFPVEK